MTDNTNSLTLNKVQNLLLFLVVVFVSITLFFARGAVSPQKSLDLLARRSLLPEIAFSNARPTLIEFYADWCDVCGSMAKSMVSLESKYSSKIDFLVLNVDNPRWEYLIEEYGVNGIPQFNILDSNANSVAKLIGRHSQEEMEDILASLAEGKPLPPWLEIESERPFSEQSTAFNVGTYKEISISPRSHSL